MPPYDAVTRRQLLKAGAGAAAAGAIGVSAVAGLTLATTTAGTAAEGVHVMVRLRDEASGALEVFVGTERIQLHDAELAARIAAAARRL